MTAVATLAQLADADDPINGVGGTVAGGYLRDRWNQRATVKVSDAGDAIFVNDSMLNVWRRGHSKLGTATGDETGPDYVIPQ